MIELDVTSPESVASAFAAVAARGPVEVLVNNAGIGGATPLELVPEDEHRQMFETNYFGAIRCIQAVLPGMRERRPRRDRQRDLDRRADRDAEPDPLLGVEVRARVRRAKRSRSRCAASGSAW